MFTAQDPDALIHKNIDVDADSIERIPIADLRLWVEKQIMKFTSTLDFEEKKSIRSHFIDLNDVLQYKIMEVNHRLAAQSDVDLMDDEKKEQLTKTIKFRLYVVRKRSILDCALRAMNAKLKGQAPKIREKPLSRSSKQLRENYVYKLVVIADDSGYGNFVLAQTKDEIKNRAETMRYIFEGARQLFGERAVVINMLSFPSDEILNEDCFPVAIIYQRDLDIDIDENSELKMLNLNLE